MMGKILYKEELEVHCPSPRGSCVWTLKQHQYTQIGENELGKRKKWMSVSLGFPECDEK